MALQSLKKSRTAREIRQGNTLLNATGRNALRPLV